MRIGSRADRWCAAWSLLLAGVLLGPALGAGYVLSYDMVWVPDLALRPGFAGLGSELPRAVPSDAVVAVVDTLVPGLVLQKLVLVSALGLGGVGASLLAPASLVARLAAVGLYQWNPLVVERLLIGHWPVLLGYAVLPWLVVLGRRWREQGRLPVPLLLLVPLGSLSASAGVATAVTLVAFAVGRGRRRALAGLLLAANAPWLAAGMLHASAAVTDPSGARVFALHGEGAVPAPLAALTLGGIWNSEVVPGSRTGALGWVALAVLLALAAIGAGPWWRATAARDRAAHLACWSLGWALAVATWAVPGAVGWLGAHVPGLGLFRDGARTLVLCAPLLVALVAHGVATARQRLSAPRVAGWSTAVAAALLPVALLPDAAWGVAGQLHPARFPDSYWQARAVVADVADEGPVGDALLLPLSSYRQPAWNHDRKVLDPLGRFLTVDYVASDELWVSGTRVPGEDPRVRQARQALAAPTAAARAERLAALGVGVVVVDRTAPESAAVPDVAGERLLATSDLVVLLLADVAPQRTAAGGVGLMALAWVAFAVVPAGAVGVAVRRRRDTAGSH